MRAPVIRSMTATATAWGRRLAIARAAGPATTRSYGPEVSSLTELSNLLNSPYGIPRGNRPLRLPKLPHGLVVGDQLERLFEGLEIFRADEHGRRAPVACDDDALVLALNALDDLGEMVSD